MRSDRAVIAASNLGDDLQRFIASAAAGAIGAGDEAWGEGHQVVEILPERGFASRRFSAETIRTIGRIFGGRRQRRISWIGGSVVGCPMLALQRQRMVGQLALAQGLGV